MTATVQIHLHKSKWCVFSCLYHMCYCLMMADNQNTMYPKLSFEAVNNTSPIVEFRDRTVGIPELATISSIVTNASSSLVTDVSFVRCRSYEWIKISKRLVRLPQLITLLVEHCDSEDSLCVSICDSKSLSVRMGRLCVIHKNAVSPAKESNYSLIFSSWLNCVSAVPRKGLTIVTPLSLLL
jgi:hypothetical protein